MLESFRGGAARKRALSKKGSKKHETHTRLLDFLEDAGHLTKSERQQVPVAAFARLAENKINQGEAGLFH